jgi:DNA-binding winged helix-turn-helix (wHTH) protein/tetratricopeptide (TPR) repeat protein
MIVSFAGFQLDGPRAELRGPSGETVKLRPKTLALLTLFAANPGRVLGKQELMEAVWPNVHVGDDSLFQCIREIRTALGDDRRQLIRLVSGRGYLFEAEVLEQATARAAPESPGAVSPGAVSPGAVSPPAPTVVEQPARRSRLFGLRSPIAIGLAVLGVISGLVVAFGIAGLGTPSVGRGPPTIAVMPITGADADAAAMAADLTTRLADGLAKIENIRVAASPTGQPEAAQSASTVPRADYIISGELQKGTATWEVRMRMTRTANGEVIWTEPATIAVDDNDLALQQSRLAAGIGHPLALRISALLDPAAKTVAASRGSPPGSANVVIEQATASIMQTTRDRFATAQTMLEGALAADPDNVDLAVALSALQMRGIQMVWYSAPDSAAAETKAKSVLQHALQLKPNSIPVLEAYCRFLNATNEFAESLVACARVLNFDPWNGLALYHIGLAQMQLGRLEDALATFKQADRFDTPLVSRWTWRLGVGMIYLLMNRSGDALPWLQSSIAITPASGRPYMLLAAAYQALNQPEQAKAAMDKALALRPGSTRSNVALPRKNSSPDFIAASEWITRAFVASGLPDQ